MVAAGAPFILDAGPGTAGGGAGADDDAFAVTACGAPPPPSEGGATMTATGQDLTRVGICVCDIANMRNSELVEPRKPIEGRCVSRGERFDVDTDTMSQGIRGRWVLVGTIASRAASWFARLGLDLEWREKCP